MRGVLVLIIVLFVGGCGVTTPQNLGNQYKFTLSAAKPKAQAIPAFGSLVLGFPKADTELDTYRIALLRDDQKRDYFAGARWADFLPAIAQSTMVESLQNSGHFSAVTANYSNFSADYKLQGDIKLFHADYTRSMPPTIAVKVHLNLVDLNTQQSIKSFSVIKERQAKSDTLSAIYKSFDSAFTAAQKDALRQVVKALRRSN